MKKYIFFMLVSFAMMTYVAPVQAQSKNDRWHIRQGNRMFRHGRVDDAATEYLKAMQIDSLNPQALYNRGRAILQKGIKLSSSEQTNTMNEVDSLFRKADSLFVAAAQLEVNPIRRAMSYHNIGWIYQKWSKLEMAIEAYKEALRNNPNDEETRYNLALCQWQLKKQQNKDGNQQDQNDQQNQDDQKDNKDQQDKDKNKDQQQNQNKDQNQDQNQDKNNQDQNNRSQNQQGDGQQDQPQMSEQNMQRMLDAVNRKEQETQEKLGRAKSASQSRTLNKNW